MVERSDTHHSAGPSLSRHLVSQLLGNFDRESRLDDLFERDFAIDEAPLGLDRTKDVADAFLRRNTGVIEARLNHAISIRSGLLVHF